MTHRYQIIVYWSDNDNSYVAEVPELTGLEVVGSTYEEALSAAQVSMSEWIERAVENEEPIPEPQGRIEVTPKTGRAGRRQERIDKRRRKREKTRWERRHTDDD